MSAPPPASGPVQRDHFGALSGHERAKSVEILKECLGAQVSVAFGQFARLVAQDLLEAIQVAATQDPVTREGMAVMPSSALWRSEWK